MTTAKKKFEATAQKRCDSFQLSIIIPEAGFALESFARDFLGTTEPLKPERISISGPLRVSQRGKPRLSISGRAEYHTHPDENHFFFVITARPVSANVPSSKAPTLSAFLNAIKAALQADEVDIRGHGQHQFSKDEWAGVVELPVPLHFGSPEQRQLAQMVGVEVAFSGEAGIETVLLSASDADFTAATRFPFRGTITENLLWEAMAASEGIALRLLQEVARQKQETFDE